MAKKIVGYVKLQCPAGKANPSPPVGPALGQHGVNIMEFCKQFNAKTQKGDGILTPVVITVYADHSFSFVVKTPPAAVLIMKELGRKIAETKLPDLNTDNIESAMRTVAGTCRSMGVDIVD